MPGIAQYKPAHTSALGIYLSTYTSARSLPRHVWTALQENERAANVILPHALASICKEDIPGQLWITCETALTPNAEPQLEFILSCVKWQMGTYPIFIVSTLPTSSLTPAFLAPRVAMLAAELQVWVPSSRVYSIFAPAPLTKAFSQAWSNVTGVELEDQPYYAARFTNCSRRTFVDRSLTLLPDCVYNLRLACEDDIPAVAALCKGFASDADPFILDDAGALNEATYLVNNKIAWVHEVLRNGASELACLVATTRNSDNVATISKVYTPPAWRKRGCAERLVRRVCKQSVRLTVASWHLKAHSQLCSFLVTQRKQWVVLYVAHNNPAAAKVYDKVGFTGLCGKPRADGVDDWLEIGCRNAEIGHW
ncbi:hypothetical protein JB92DRAFT_2825217 [Gautieria morchelliformis]|nr:hypothetical protein JB92DRAFT_2825217 [Gautieria morchelliformis]